MYEYLAFHCQTISPGICKTGVEKASNCFNLIGSVLTSKQPHLEVRILLVRLKQYQSIFIERGTLCFDFKILWNILYTTSYSFPGFHWILKKYNEWLASIRLFQVGMYRLPGGIYSNGNMNLIRALLRSPNNKICWKTAPRKQCRNSQTLWHISMVNSIITLTFRTNCTTAYNHPDYRHCGNGQSWLALPYHLMSLRRNSFHKDYLLLLSSSVFFLLIVLCIAKL